MKQQIVTLLTDFGQKDTYLAEIKAILLKSKRPPIIVDISHEIESFSIFDGAFKFFRSYKFFPHGTIHLVIVDPGVGTERKCIYVRTRHFHFIAPDNGILSWALMELKEPLNIFEIPVPKTASTTFHGRDVFAPFILKLLEHKRPKMKKIKKLKLIPFPKPKIETKSIHTKILSIDKFGNIVTSIPNTENLSKLKLKKEELHLSQNYQSIDEKSCALIKGSHGFYEISKKNGSAAKWLRVDIGESLTLMKLSY